MITTTALLERWERGTTLPMLDRAPSLLAMIDPDCDPDQLTIGQCDALVYTLYHQLFGDRIDAICACPDCGEQVSFPLSVERLQPELRSSVGPVEASVDGYSLRLRVPLNADLRELAQLGDRLQLSDVLDRCLVSLEGPGGASAQVHDLPDLVVETAADLLSQADPAANITVGITCPCGYAWSDVVDIRILLWEELTRWARHRLEDVDTLARAYGWTERDILGLSPARRAWYVQATE
jgi:hypothetical protein